MQTSLVGAFLMKSPATEIAAADSLRRPTALGRHGGRPRQFQGDHADTERSTGLVNENLRDSRSNPSTGEIHFMVGTREAFVTIRALVARLVPTSAESPQPTAFPHSSVHLLEGLTNVFPL